MRVKLKYHSFFQITVPAGLNAAFQVFRCNSIYDPDAAVGGAQPRGSSQWAAFYEKYTVVSSKCSMRLLDEDTGTSTAGTVTGLYGIRIGDTSTPGDLTVRSMVEDVDSSYKAFDSFHANQQVTRTFNTAKHFGVENLLDNAQLSGKTGATLVGSDPLDQAYFLCWAVQAPPTGAVAQAMKCEVLITYDVILSDPKDLAAS